MVGRGQLQLSLLSKLIANVMPRRGPNRVVRLTKGCEDHLGSRKGTHDTNCLLQRKGRICGDLMKSQESASLQDNSSTLSAHAGYHVEYKSTEIKVAGQ